jgi:uncharacterized protein YaiE (UPF0345 family)
LLLAITYIELLSAADWQTFNTGEIFEVEANSSFDVKVAMQTAYLCMYEK